MAAYTNNATTNHDREQINLQQHIQITQQEIMVKNKLTYRGSIKGAILETSAADDGKK